MLARATRLLDGRCERVQGGTFHAFCLQLLRRYAGLLGFPPTFTLLDAADFSPDETFAYLCGPEIMMRLSARELVSRGVPPAQIYLSMERNMKCAIGLCGHCQMGNAFICKEGPVFDLPGGAAVA